MQGQIMSEQADQHTFRVRRSQETVLAREDHPRLEQFTAVSVIPLLSLGLWSAIWVGVSLIASAVWWRHA
jgi:hypothetical protein